VCQTGQGKVAPVYAMKAYRGNSDITPLLLYFALSEGKWSTSCPCCLTPQERPQYPWIRRLSGPQSQS